MDLGKLKLPLGSTFNGDVFFSLQDIYVSFQLLGIELAKTSGTASITTSAIVTTGKAVAIVGGLAKHADAATNVPALGICVTGAAAGKKALIMLGMGYVGGLTGLTANASIYLGNAGALLFVKPGAGFIQGLGQALSTTELFVTISQP